MSDLTIRPLGFEQAVPLREAVNSLFSQSFLNPTWGTMFGQPGTLGMGLDVYEDNENYYILGVLPGVDPNKVDITSQENTLIISGEIPSFVPQGKRVLWQELPVGSFRRALTLPAAFDVGNVEAHYGDGLLKLVLPKAASARVHKIKIGTSGAPASGNSSNNK
jgi:HSP20 family protein